MDEVDPVYRVIEDHRAVFDGALRWVRSHGHPKIQLPFGDAGYVTIEDRRYGHAVHPTQLDDILEEVRALRARLEEVFPKAPTPEETLSTTYDASVGWLKDHGHTTAIGTTRVERRPIRDTEPTSC